MTRQASMADPRRRVAAAHIHTQFGRLLRRADAVLNVVPYRAATSARLPLMNILLLGSGGREHALAWKIAASPL